MSGYQAVRNLEAAPAEAAPSPVRHHWGDLVKSLVLGGTDGLLSTVAVLSAAAGGGLSWQYSLIMGFGGVVAGSLAYGLGEFLSFKSQRDYITSAKRTKTWELKNSKEAAVAQVVRKFTSRGMGAADAELAVARMAAYPAFFVNVMVSEELGMVIEDDDAALLSDGFVNVLSFASVGGLPVVLFTLLAAVMQDPSNSVYPLALAASAALAFGLGSSKGHFAAGSGSSVALGVETVVVLCVCAAAAFSCARLVSNHLG